MKNISYEELKTRKAEPNTTMINVLSAEDFEKEHIPGSFNIPLKSVDFEKQVERQLGRKVASVIVYCASSECSASRQAAEKLEAAGFTNVTTYEGGMKEWNEKTKLKAA